MDPTKAFTCFANIVSRAAGRPLAFILCIVGVVIWAVTGPLFGFSDTWQLVINTSTTIITFLMVFLIQNTQNRDNAAVQAKLDELIRVTSAKNGFIGIEKLTDKELEEILASFARYDDETPIGKKSEIINRKARQVKNRNASHKRDATPAKAKVVRKVAARKTA